jgi:nicotinamide-nucleotide amidase
MIARDLISALRERGQTVAVAESLTGGLICAALIEVSGASAAVRGGVVAYATELKHRLLDVDAGLLARNGPVDPDVAAQMALGVRERLGADWGLATTGVAGPDPQDGVEPGRVYVGIAGPLVAVPAGTGALADPMAELADPALGDRTVPAGAGADGSEAGDASGVPPPIATRVLELDLPGDRTAIREASTAQALGALLAALREVGTAEDQEQVRPTGR